MTTIHILTKNNEKTIAQALESVVGSNIIVGDYGSSDKTVEICKSFGAKIISVKGLDRSEARMQMSELSNDRLNIWLEPWECVQNPQYLNKSGKANVRILQNGIITWEARVWENQAKFSNPIFEKLETKDTSQSNLIFISNGSLDLNESLESVSKWKSDQPFLKQPYYYHSCLLLACGKYEEFIKCADHYLFLDKSSSMSAIMTRYYYAIIQLTYKKSVKPCLQNLNLCLCAKPLMSEFWCLTGDVYYHLLNKFDLAKEFYENAQILGSRRLSTDLWPMDIAKYNKYPKMMIDSCGEIIKTRSDYTAIKRLETSL
jgi:glycosyltransferase involved in cell wall biosynthesis